MTILLLIPLTPAWSQHVDLIKTDFQLKLYENIDQGNLLTDCDDQFKMLMLIDFSSGLLLQGNSYERFFHFTSRASLLGQRISVLRC
jgi:hypothetical protein